MKEKTRLESRSTEPPDYHGEESSEIVYSHDLDGRILFLNKTGLALLGYRGEDPTRLTLRELLPPREHERVMEVVDRLVQGEARAEPFRTELRKKDGAGFAVEISLRLFSDSRGLPCGVQGIAREMGSRREADHAKPRFDLNVQQLLSEIEAARLFPLVVRHATETLSADAAVLLLVEGRGFTVGASAGIPEGGTILAPLVSGPWPAATIQAERPIVVTDLLADPLLGGTGLVRQFSFTRLMVAPLGVFGERLGCLALFFRTPRVVRADELQFLRNFGQQVAIAVKNARLYADARRRRQGAETLARVVGELSGSLTLSEVIHRVVEGAREIGGAECAALVLESMRDGRLETPGFSGALEPAKEGRVGLSHAVAQAVLQTHRPFLSENAPEDPRITGALDDTVLREGIVTIAAVPLPVKGDRRGALQVGFRAPRSIPIDLVERLTRFAHSAAAAIENAHVHAAVEQQVRALQLREAQMVHTTRLAAFGQWAAALAHAIKTPLAAVMGFAELALRRLPADDENRQALETIREEAERMDQIVARQLAFVSAAPTELMPLDVKDLLSEAVRLFSGVFERERVEVELNVAPELPVIHGDRWQLEEVLMNLLSNAVDAMPGGGKLRIWARPGPDRMVEIGVSDSGQGIPASHRSSIWEPFFTTKPAGKGTGLGLPLSRSMIAHHGGSISLESEEGRGTIVKVWLPSGAR